MLISLVGIIDAQNVVTTERTIRHATKVYGNGRLKGNSMNRLNCNVITIARISPTINPSNIELKVTAAAS